LIRYRQAQQLVLEKARSFGTEIVPLEQAGGRVLSGVIRADRDYPPFPRATMDGYAMQFHDLEQGVRRFIVVETIMAGHAALRSIGRGECYKIMTGAAVPESADIVIRRENMEEGAGYARILPILPDPLPAGTLPAPADPRFPWRRYQNIARQGEDLAAGAVVIHRPVVCEPAVIGLLATLGQTMITVERSPGIGLLTTGNEVIPPGDPIGPVQIRNSNRWLLESALKKSGAGHVSITHSPDEPSILRAAIDKGLEHDILILSGGVSAGDADYVPGTLAAAGVRQLFHRVAIRPGKPVWVGVAPGGCMVFALPGNPFSCLVNMILLIRPYLQACYGLPAPEPLGLPLAVARKKKSPLDEFFPAGLHGAPAALSPVTLNGSGDIRLGMEANMLALHPAESGDLEAGDSVLCYPI
jgi:molybdopterin molybdotransferase